MNKTERSYANHLEILVRSGGLLRWRFEPLKFRLGRGCYYTPDFEVITSARELEYHEVKGFWRDDARVKIKAAASLMPDRRFVAVQLVRGRWKIEEIKP